MSDTFQFHSSSFSISITDTSYGNVPLAYHSSTRLTAMTTSGSQVHTAAALGLHNINTCLTTLCLELPGWARDSGRQWHQLGHMQVCTSP